MKSKNTKSALFMSILSVMLCMAMLIGSTFAWFTDNVTSGKNKIVAGNLDIELNYKNAKMAADGESFAEVLPTTENLFVNSEGNDIRWEPGAVAVTYLELKNAGNLALKYQLSVDAADTVTGIDGAALSKVLKTAVVEIAETEVGTYDRATAVQKAKAADAESILGYKKPGEMTEQGQVKYLAMIVYFPEEIGNTYEGAVYNRSDVALEIELSLNLVATQMPYEKDSFGDQYDVKAEYPAVKVSSASDLRAALKNENVKVVLENNIQIDDNKPYEIEANQIVEIDLNGYSIIAPDIEDVNIITVYNKGGNLTLKNGKIINEDTDATGYNEDAPYRNAALESYGGTLTVENCTISNHAGNSGSYAVKVANSTDGNGCVATFTNTDIIGTRGGLNPTGNAQVTYNGGSIKADYFYPVFLANNAVAQLNGTEIIKNGNGGNFAMYVAVSEEQTGLLTFNNCILKSTVDNIKMAVTGGDGINRIVLNDCTIENITNNVPIPTVDGDNTDDPFGA